jgi:hypothetical protein
MHGCAAVAIMLCACSGNGPSAGQDSNAAAEARPATQTRTVARDPAAYAYGAEHRVTEQEGRRRLDNEVHVSALARSLRLRPIAGYADLWIRHEPTYAIVVDFKGSPPRHAVLARAQPAIHHDIVLRTAKRNRREIVRDNDRITALLRSTPGEWVGGYDVKTGRFEYRFASPAAVASAEKRIPADLRNDVVLRIGAVPRPLTR